MAIMMGLAIGAAMGGGIAALQGKKMDEILKSAAIGGVTGAAGAGIAPLLTAGTAGTAATVAATEAAAPIVTSEAILANAGAATNPIATNTGTEVISSGGANLGFKAPVPSGWGMPSTNFGADAVVSQGPGFRMPAPDTSSLIAGKQPGLFDSGIGKFLADNKGTLGLGAAGLLMSNKGNSQSSQPESDSYIRPYTYDPKNQTYAAQEPVKASDWGTRMIAEGGAIRMAEGGETTQEQRESTSNPTLEALAAIQQAQQSYQPPQPTVSQGITQPLIQPQMAEVQQRYATPQRAVPADFQYQAPQFVSYGIGGGGSGAGGGYGNLVDPTTGKPIGGGKPGTPGGGGNKPGDKPGNKPGDNPYKPGDTAPYDPKNPTSIIPETGKFRRPVPINSLNPDGVVGYDNNPLKSEEIGRAQIQYGTSPGESNRYTVPISPYANAGGGIGSEAGGDFKAGAGYEDYTMTPGYHNLNTPTSKENLANIYKEMLGRAPDTSGAASFANQSPDQVVSAIIASPEYQAKNGPAPEPTYYYGGQAMYTPEYAEVPGFQSGIGSSGGDGGGGGGDADGGLIADKHPKYAMGGGIGGYYPEPDDGNRNFGGIESLNQGPQYPMQGIGYAMGGQLGGYSDGGQLLRGPGDGVSDDIPAQIGQRQPARLADGEFVIPARIVSELGNGSTDAGAKRLYAMMERIQANRSKTVGKDKVAVDSKARKHLPA